MDVRTQRISTMHDSVFRLCHLHSHFLAKFNSNLTLPYMKYTFMSCLFSSGMKFRPIFKQLNQRKVKMQHLTFNLHTTKIEGRVHAFVFV